MIHLKKIKVRESQHGVDMPSQSHSLHAPSFSVMSEQMPEIKDWKVGEKYRLMIEVEQKAMTKIDVDGKSSIEARFDIVAYKHLPKKSIEDMNDDEFGEYMGKSLDKGELA